MFPLFKTSFVCKIFDISCIYYKVNDVCICKFGDIQNFFVQIITHTRNKVHFYGTGYKSPFFVRVKWE